MRVSTSVRGPATTAGVPATSVRVPATAVRVPAAAARASAPSSTGIGGGRQDQCDRHYRREQCYHRSYPQLRDEPYQVRTDFACTTPKGRRVRAPHAFRRPHSTSLD